MGRFKIEPYLLKNGYVRDRDNPYVMANAYGISFMFFTTDNGKKMFTMVDRNKPRHRWHIMTWMCPSEEFVYDEEDFLCVMEGTTAFD